MKLSWHCQKEYKSSVLSPSWHLESTISKQQFPDDTGTQPYILKYLWPIDLYACCMSSCEILSLTLINIFVISFIIPNHHTSFIFLFFYLKYQNSQGILFDTLFHSPLLLSPSYMHPYPLPHLWHIMVPVSDIPWYLNSVWHLDKIK